METVKNFAKLQALDLEGTAKLKRLEVYQPILANEDHAQVYAASFAPDGRSVVTANSNGVVAIWALPDPPSNLARILHCQVSYELVGDRMIHHAIPTDCTSHAP